MRLALLLTFAWVNALAQPRPLHNISPTRSTEEISILRVDLQDLKPAHGGPSYFSVKRAPFRGKSEIAEVTVFGQEAIATIRFELIDEAGRVLQAVSAARTGNAIDSDGYALKLDVPDRPFRLRIRGSDLRGRPFTHTWPRLFVPMEGTPAAPIPAELEAQFRPGDLRMSRAAISEAAYEPLVSANGNPLGLRIRFTVRFEAPGYYDVTPHVFPVYAEHRWRGEISMRALSVERTQFDAGTDYHLTYDMIPGYVGRNHDGSYCVQAPPRIAVFEEIMASRQPVKYRVDIASLDFVSETDPLDPQRTWFEGFRREGATQCVR
jgi:hypothetical protein